MFLLWLCLQCTRELDHFRPPRTLQLLLLPEWVERTREGPVYPANHLILWESFSYINHISKFPPLIFTTSSPPTVSIFWNSGRLLFDLCPPPTDHSSEAIYLGASQIAADFHGQLTVLYAVLHLAPLAGFLTSPFLVFTLAWLLNDLASPLCLLESGRSFNNNLKTSSQDRLLTFSAIIRAFISSQTSSLFNLNKGLSFDLCKFEFHKLYSPKWLETF